MRRISTHQLKALLENLDNAAVADHPLSAMFRGFIKDALLDLRDLIAEESRLDTLLDYKKKAIDGMQERILGAIKINPKERYDWLEREILYLIDWSTARSVNLDYVEKQAIAPLTGKEK